MLINVRHSTSCFLFCFYFINQWYCECYLNVTNTFHFFHFFLALCTVREVNYRMLVYQMIMLSSHFHIEFSEDWFSYSAVCFFKGKQSHNVDTFTRYSNTCVHLQLLFCYDKSMSQTSRFSCLCYIIGLINIYFTHKKNV